MVTEEPPAHESTITWWPRRTKDDGSPWTRPEGATVGNLVDEHDWFLVDDSPGPALPVFVRLGKDAVSGRLVCTGLIVGDLNPFGGSSYHGRLREINAAALRAIHIPELLAGALRSAETPDEFGTWIRDFNERAPMAGRTARPSSAGYDDTHFAEVAKAYRAALIEAPHAPTKLVAERFGRSTPTARRWIQRARDRGYLGAATPGKAGEQEQA